MVHENYIEMAVIWLQFSQMSSEKKFLNYCNCSTISENVMVHFFLLEKGILFNFLSELENIK